MTPEPTLGGCARARWIVPWLMIGLGLLIALAAHGQGLDGDDATPLDAKSLVERVEEVFRGDTAQMKAAMTIQRPRWTRTVVFRSWDDRHGDRSFIRILDPKKDRGTGFLRDERTFWTYLPRVERTTRIPPSMMLQPWMGSDFTNDDLVRESSLIDDYTARYLGTKQLDGVEVHGVELLPNPEAPVVWARIEIWVETGTLAPRLEIFYDEPEPGRFEPVRRMIFSDVRDVQGRPLPHRWHMETKEKPDHTTSIVLEEMVFDEKLGDEIFSLTNLKRAEAAR
jgi:outer membrane lipoprotein-sorting protein